MEPEVLPELDDRPPARSAGPQEPAVVRHLDLHRDVHRLASEADLGHPPGEARALLLAQLEADMDAAGSPLALYEAAAGLD